MFDFLAPEFGTAASMVSHRSEGAAFLRAAKDLYTLNSLTYLCVNLPVRSRRNAFAHCLYSDSCIKQFMSGQQLRTTVPKPVLDVGTDRGNTASKHPEGIIVLPLRQRFGETAVLAVSADGLLHTEDKERTIAELRVLASYFHSHVLRINGYDSANEMLISARELDCLKWTAAGKTAWEASVILGISERTVRFHLNAAREKLDCATTTQAVAKAIMDNLIDLHSEL
jgi:DNA-binding CsgD family transcriptional regulator